jgi:hypothetical protein
VRIWRSLSCSRNPLSFIEPYDSLPFSLRPVTDHCNETDESNAHYNICLFLRSIVISFHHTWISKRSLPFRCPLKNLYAFKIVPMLSSLSVNCFRSDLITVEQFRIKLQIILSSRFTIRNLFMLIKNVNTPSSLILWRGSAHRKSSTHTIQQNKEAHRLYSRAPSVSRNCKPNFLL